MGDRRDRTRSPDPGAVPGSGEDLDSSWLLVDADDAPADMGDHDRRSGRVLRTSSTPVLRRPPRASTAAAAAASTPSARATSHSMVFPVVRARLEDLHPDMAASLSESSSGDGLSITARQHSSDAVVPSSGGGGGARGNSSSSSSEGEGGRRSLAIASASSPSRGEVVSVSVRSLNNPPPITATAAAIKRDASPDTVATRCSTTSAVVQATAHRRRPSHRMFLGFDEVDDLPSPGLLRRRPWGGAGPPRPARDGSTSSDGHDGSDERDHDRRLSFHDYYSSSDDELYEDGDVVGPLATDIWSGFKRVAPVLVPSVLSFAVGVQVGNGSGGGGAGGGGAGGGAGVGSSAVGGGGGADVLTVAGWPPYLPSS